MSENGNGVANSLDTCNLQSLPKGWCWATVEQLGDVVTGSTPSKSNPAFFGGTIPFFKPTDLNAGYHVRSYSDSLTEEGSECARLLPPRTVLVTCIGATIGKTGLARVKCATNQQINAVITNSDIRLPEWIYWAFVSSWGQSQILDNASATTLPILNKGRFAKLTLPVAPTGEQYRIVDKIEELFSDLDAGIAALERAKANLTRYRAAVLKASMERKIEFDDDDQDCDSLTSAADEIATCAADYSADSVRRGVPTSIPLSETAKKINIPNRWELVSIADLLRKGVLIDVKDGNHGENHPKKNEFSSEGLPFVTASEVADFRIDFRNAPKVSGEVLDRLNVGFAKPNDVILTHKGSVGRVSICTQPCVLSPQTTYYRTRENILYPSFLQYYLASPQFYSQLAEVKSQTTRDYVSISKKYKLFVLFPPYGEQVLIAREIDRRLTLQRAADESISKSLLRAIRLRQSILKRAFEGKLVPQDSNDEPASILLERIKAERETTNSNDKPKKRRTKRKSAKA